MRLKWIVVGQSAYPLCNRCSSFPWFLGERRIWQLPFSVSNMWYTSSTAIYL